MDDIQIDSQTDSEEEINDPRTPIRKPSVVKLQKQREDRKQLATAGDRRAASKYIRGGKKNVQFSTHKEILQLSERNQQPFFAREPIRPESLYMEMH